METIRSFFLWVIGLSMGVSAVVFGIGNPQLISLSFWHWQSMQLPLWSIAALGFLAGFITAFFLTFRSIFRAKRVEWQWKKQASKLEKELTSLRNLPLTEPNIIHEKSAHQEIEIPQNMGSDQV